MLPPYYLTMEAILPNMTNVYKLTASGMLICSTATRDFQSQKLHIKTNVLQKAGFLVLFVNAQRPTLQPVLISTASSPRFPYIFRHSDLLNESIPVVSIAKFAQLVIDSDQTELVENHDTSLLTSMYKLLTLTQIA